MGQLTYNSPLVEIGPCKYGGKFSYNGTEVKGPRWEVKIEARCRRSRFLGFLWKTHCDRPDVTLLTSTTPYDDVRTGFPDQHFIFSVGATRSDPLGDCCVVITFKWMMWTYLSTDQLKPVTFEAGIDGFFVGHGDAKGMTVPSMQGSFQVKVCCEEVAELRKRGVDVPPADPDEDDSGCRPVCTLLNQIP